MNTSEIKKFVELKFKESAIPVADVTIRSFPGELIVVVSVSGNLDAAVTLANELDCSIEDGFITVKKVDSLPIASSTNTVKSIFDDRVNKVIELLESRSRASETQPALQYIQDVEGRLSSAVARRNHLIFGRRGVGKTALMLEAKKKLEQSGEKTIWINMQTLRTLDFKRAFLAIAERIVELPSISYIGSKVDRRSLVLSGEIKEEIKKIQSKNPSTTDEISIVVPKIQRLLNIFCAELQCGVYVFLDDTHYLTPNDVPHLLDLLHSITRDNPVWLKVAGIRHQMRWFVGDPPTGLQTGHDASLINLDVTLHEPAKAKIFLENILTSYVEAADARPRRGFLSDGALDRLVLASGGVPRDFATLCASAIQIARRRSNARLAGVQDVNNAAGEAMQIKMQELDDDAASDVGTAGKLRKALDIVSNFLLAEQQITFLRIDFKDKESRTFEYNLTQSLMDLRMLHLVNPSLSDKREAGRRSEVYLLDLSQYSGSRLKQKLRVLDFSKNCLVLKKTRSSERPRWATTASKLIEILRFGPIFELSMLENLVN